MNKEKLGVLLFIGLLVIWGLTDVRSRASFDPLKPEKHRTDLTVFTEAGAAFYDGRDPYEVTNPRGWKYPNPPLFALLVAPLHALDPQWQGVIWFGLSLALAWGCFIEGRRLMAGARSVFTWTERMERMVKPVSWYTFAAALPPSLACLQRGQMGLAKTYFLLLGFRLIWLGRGRRQWLTGGVALALACVLKVLPIFPVFVLLMMLAVRPRLITSPSPSRFLNAFSGMALGGALFLFLIPAGLVGWKDNLSHLNSWVYQIGTKVSGIESTHRLGDPHTLRNQSFANAVFWLGNVLHNAWTRQPSLLHVDTRREGDTIMSRAPAQTVIHAARYFIVLLFLLFSWQTARSGTPGDQAAVFGLACVAALLFSPVARGHYFMFLIPAWLFVPLALMEKGLYAAARWMSLSSLALILGHFIFLPFLGKLGWLGVGSTLWLATAMILLGRTLFKHHPVMSMQKRC
ncbi:MAG: glycosyltransferase family 87 protein [Nitrospinaceae bacterium]